MSSFLADTAAFITVLIGNQWNEIGTGFLVSKQFTPQTGKIFLVTNKHVLNKDSTLREQATHIEINYNARNESGDTIGRTMTFPIKLPNGEKIWRQHPNQDVDVLVFDVTGFINIVHSDIVARWMDYNLLCTKEMLVEHEITIGDDIIVVGYPMGLKHRNNNLPLFRSGIIATSIGHELEDKVAEGEGYRDRVLLGFLIDGAVIGGSSGSPVLLKPNFTRIDRSGNMELGSSLPPFILGIVAETRYFPIQITEEDTGEEFIIPSLAGLGLAFDAMTIRETIDSFFE